MNQTSRLRMFAGPNGSGKSTLKSVLQPELLGYYINPDEIEKQILLSGMLDLSQFSIETNEKELLHFFENSILLQKANLLSDTARIKFSRGKLNFENLKVNSYFASVTSDFIRQKLLASGQSFTFETVMSSPDKIHLLAKAQKAGYRTYLYYVATEDPNINISRVKQRVKTGGHNVPEDKIISRYYRSLDLLFDAVRNSNRAYIFDNSGNDLVFICEITEAKDFLYRVNPIPQWFKTYVLDKI